MLHTYSYDAANRMVSFVSPAGLTTTTYDQLDRVRSVVTPLGKPLTYSYNAAGQRAAMQSISGLTTYTYDANGNHIGLVNSRGRVTTWTYDAIDKQAGKRLHNGLIVSHIYDAAGWLKVIQNVKSSGAAQSIFTYTYDKLSELKGTGVIVLCSTSKQPSDCIAGSL